MQNEFPIDAVVMWVDGDDPAHRAKRQSFMHNGSEARHDDVAGETRYRQVGEIMFCVASILRFASFVRKIYIVTDNQNPHLDEFLALNFPDRTTPVEIVDHKVIFRGYEQYLPTFSSCAIEAMLWRIPGIAEHHIYFNDDIILFSPARRSDFFTDEGYPVAYGYWHLSSTARLLRAIRPSKKGHRTVMWRDTMLNSGDILGLHRFLRITHAAYQMRRSFFEKFYAEHPDVLLRNISHRFRDADNYSVQALEYLAMNLEGQCRIDTSACNLYMKPKRNRRLPDDAALAKFDADPKALFLCMNSLDSAAPEDTERIIAWLSRRLDVKIPTPPVR